MIVSTLDALSTCLIIICVISRIGLLMQEFSLFYYLTIYFLKLLYDNTQMHKELHRFVNEPPGRPPPAPRRPAAVTPPARRPRFMRSESIVDEYENSVFDERLFDNIHHFGEKQVL